MQNTTHKDLQNSGLYNKPFFITKYLSINDIDIDDIYFSKKLYRKYSCDEDELYDLSEDIYYYDALSKNYREKNYVNYDDINALFDHSSYISYIRNDMHLFRNKNLRSEIYSYLFKKNSLLQDIKYNQTEIYTRLSNRENSNELYDNLSKKLLELTELRQKAEELNKSLANY